METSVSKKEKQRLWRPEAPEYYLANPALPLYTDQLLTAADIQSVRGNALKFASKTRHSVTWDHVESSVGWWEKFRELVTFLRTS